MISPFTGSFFALAIARSARANNFSRITEPMAPLIPSSLWPLRSFVEYDIASTTAKIDLMKQMNQEERRLGSADFGKSEFEHDAIRTTSLQLPRIHFLFFCSFKNAWKRSFTVVFFFSVVPTFIERVTGDEKATPDVRTAACIERVTGDETDD